MSGSHSEIEALLPELVNGELSKETHSRVERHVARCETCDEWVATHRLLAAVERSALRDHPTSEQLATYLVDPSGQEASEKSRIEGHLAECSSCSREVDLCTEALAVETPPAAGDLRMGSVTAKAQWTGGRPASGPAWSTRPFRALLAASVLLALLVAGFSLLGGEHRAIPHRQSVTRATLTGERTFEAEHAIAANALRIDSGAKITLRAGVVALGNGFRVDPDAELVIEATGPSAKKPPRERVEGH